jgi:hypothetical protein
LNILHHGSVTFGSLSPFRLSLYSINLMYVYISKGCVDILYILLLILIPQISNLHNVQNIS